MLKGWTVSTDGVIEASPILGDIDKDGKTEIIICSTDGKIYAFNEDGTIVPGFPLSVGDVIVSTPALGNIDDDDSLELIVGAFNSKIYCWDLEEVINISITSKPKFFKGSGLGKKKGKPILLPWPMFAHDAYHTGTYPK